MIHAEQSELEGFIDSGYEVLKECSDGDVILGKDDIIGIYKPDKKNFTFWKKRK